MEKSSVKILRSFGLLMGSVCSFFTLVLFYKGLKIAPFFLGTLALGFLTVGLVAPRKLQGVQEKWMKFAEVIGRFNAKLVIGFIYMVFFSLMHFIFWVIRKDFMKRKFDLSAESYWQKHETYSDDDSKRYEKQF